MNILKLIANRRRFGNFTPHDRSESANFTVDFICALAIYKGYQFASISVSTNYDIFRECQMIMSGFANIIKALVEDKNENVFLKIIIALMKRDEDPNKDLRITPGEGPVQESNSV